MTAFLVIGLAGLALLAISLIVGDLFGDLGSALHAFDSDWFESAVLGGFVSALGFAGAIAQGSGAPLIVALPVGVVAGVAFGWFAAWLTRLLKDGGSDDTVSTDDALGRDAQVVTGIPADGFGVVRVLVGGHTLRLNARASTPIDPGTEVHVTGVLSPTAVTVAPTWQGLSLDGPNGEEKT